MQSSGPSVRASFGRLDTTAVETRIRTLDEFRRFLDVASEHVSEMGNPAVVLQHPNGSSLSFAWNESHAFLSWIDPLEVAYSSEGGAPLDFLVFGYFGNWSEAPGEALVPIENGLECVRAYLETGTPEPAGVRFVPD
ncbi:Imm1 family immunity protein [Nocardioides marmorisolisilvae]|uniref:Imm1 family immunity protein n=1 Tax=Nocardioides marmorisolisilvae TaxID=1542737 RepID=UPI0016205304|nr:Imm1 family immunity protein [Nocardioides marmorisolisilvae]